MVYATLHALCIYRAKMKKNEPSLLLLLLIFFRYCYISFFFVLFCTFFISLLYLLLFGLFTLYFHASMKRILLFFFIISFRVVFFAIGCVVHNIFFIFFVQFSSCLRCFFGAPFFPVSLYIFYSVVLFVWHHAIQRTNTRYQQLVLLLLLLLPTMCKWWMCFFPCVKFRAWVCIWYLPSAPSTFVIMTLQMAMSISITKIDK